MILSKYVLLFLVNCMFSSATASLSNSSAFAPECFCDIHDTIIPTTCPTPSYCVFYRLCVNEKWCGSPDSIIPGMVTLGEIDLVIFDFTTYIPRCFIINLPELRIIQARNLKITVVESWAFWNLPKLEEIDLTFNHLTEIQYGMFSGLPISVLDVSWNQISYIGHGSFHGMKNLKKLNLNRNSLDIFDGGFYFFIKYNKQVFTPLPLEILILSQNVLIHVINLKHFPRLRSIDLSHNSMNRLNINSFDPPTKIDKLDLTDNFIKYLDLNNSYFQIRQLRIGFNNFLGVEKLLIEGSNIKYIAIDGNPWNCETYDEVLLYLYKENITVLTHNKDTGIYFLTAVERENYPTCFVPAENETNTMFHPRDKIYAYYSDLKSRYKAKKYAVCTNDHDCLDNMVCRNNQCWDPCKYNVCHKTAECQTKNHTFACSCPKGKLEKPNSIETRCYNVECFADYDCETGSKCNTLEHICDLEELLMSER